MSGRLTINAKSIFPLGCAYIHVDATIFDNRLFLFGTIIKYSENTPKIFEDMIVATEDLMVIMREFKVDAQTNLHALNLSLIHI